jgi:hypothetical protein
MLSLARGRFLEGRNDMADLTMHATWTCESNFYFSTTVEGSKGAKYVVTYGETETGPYKYDWSCTCPSAKFHKGHCKHVKAVKDDDLRCAWNWEMDPGYGEAEETAAGPCCPRCHGPVRAVRVAA